MIAGAKNTLINFFKYHESPDRVWGGGGLEAAVE